MLQSKYTHCILRVFRGEPKNEYVEEFEFECTKGLNIISLLMKIQRNPVNRAGEKTTPVVFESGCLEEVCGSCSMLINGRPRQACTALIEQIMEETKSNIITLAPLSKFPLVKDLVVDRSRIFENLKKVQAWVETESTHNEGFGSKIAPNVQEVLYSLSTCMSCGCCNEACPQVHENSEFMGPAIVSQTRLFNLHPRAHFQKTERLHIMSGSSGIGNCGNAQNCAKVCPKKIPLTESISEIFRTTRKQFIQDIFGLPEHNNKEE